jgi:nitroreductase
MQRISNSQLIENLTWRYAVKKFDSKAKIPQQDWETLEKALVLTPSSYGLQPWRFLVVQDPEVRKKLTPLSWKQTQVEDCSHFVVMAHMKKMTEEHVNSFVRSTADARGLNPESLEGYRKMMIGDVVTGPRSKVAAEWAARQCYIAMGNLMTSAAMLGIDTCPMEGLDPAGYDQVLGLAGTNYQTVMAVACGYRHTEDKLASAVKSRFEKSCIVTVV